MYNQVITDASQLNIAWLVAALERTAGVPAGSIADFSADGAASSWAHIVKIKLRYRDEALAGWPTALLLKICRGDDFGPSEYNYYTRDYVDLPDAPLPRCYDAQFSAEPRAYHLLLEDLSATHQASWELTPTQELGMAIADALANVHARYWGLAPLAALGELLPDRAAIERYIGHIRAGLAPLLAIAGGHLAPDWPARLHDIFEHHPRRMLEQTRAPEQLTLIHGDTNPGNILAPIAPGGRVYLIDRQPFDWSLTVWSGVSDLAYLMCLWWPTELRRRLEKPVLRRYHEQLARRGVAGYTWDELWRDYQLAAVQCVYVPVEWCVLERDRERMRWLWSQQLAKVMAAFDDLDCARILV